MNFIDMLLSHFSRVQLCATPGMAAHQAPPSLGFSRQEHWSALPFPSPVHESEKSKWSCSVVSDPQPPHGLQPTRLLCPWEFPGKSTGVGCHCLLRHRYDAKWKKLDSKHYIQYESIHRSSEAKLKLNKMQNYGFLSEEENHLGVTFWGGGSIPCCERPMLYQECPVVKIVQPRVVISIYENSI